MARWKWLAILGVALVALVVTVVYAQGPGGMGGPAGGMRGPMGGRMGPPDEMPGMQMLEQREARLLERAGLNKKEVALVRKTQEAKMQARRRLLTEMRILERSAYKKNATDKELREFITRYRSAMTAYRNRIASLDKALTEKVSLRSQARLLCMGVLENGLGRGGMIRGGLGMMGEMGGPGGRMGGRPGGMEGRGGRMDRMEAPPPPLAQ